MEEKGRGGTVLSQLFLVEQAKISGGSSVGGHIDMAG